MILNLNKINLINCKSPLLKKNGGVLSQIWSRENRTGSASEITNRLNIGAKWKEELNHDIIYHDKIVLVRAPATQRGGTVPLTVIPSPGISSNKFIKPHSNLKLFNKLKTKKVEKFKIRKVNLDSQNFKNSTLLAEKSSL
jgi:hypothetical protein